MNDQAPGLVAHKTFTNNKKALNGLIDWVNKQTEASVPVRFVMEATGDYHKCFSYFLHVPCLAVSIVVPNKISNYALTLAAKTVTYKLTWMMSVQKNY